MSAHSLDKTSAISIDKVAGTAPDLLGMYKDAETSLRDLDLIGRRAAVYFVIDRSFSMKEYFDIGAVQRLSDQILSLSAHLDDDGQVPVGFFSDEMYTLSRSRLRRRPQVFEEVALGDHQGRIAQLHNSLGRMGGTHYRPAMEAVLDHYRGSKAFRASIPAFVVFQTDGAPQDESATRDFLHASAHENVRWQFVPFGVEERFELLKRLPGNTGVSAVGTNPLALSNVELYNRLVTGLPRT